MEGEFSLQPESALREEERRALAQMRDTVPGFADRLTDLVEALDRPLAPRPSGTGEGPPTAEPGPSTTPLPGGAIEWVGTGGRRPLRPLEPPELTAADFGGQVPARISYLFAFKVNDQGLVIPGSLILRQSSGYTLADQKVRMAISSWMFDPSPGAEAVTAIGWFHIERAEIQ